eukprot:9497319-Pyramimonas_sp.AAC.1
MPLASWPLFLFAASSFPTLRCGGASAGWSVCLSVLSCVCPSVCPSVRLFVCLSACLSVCPLGARGCEARLTALLRGGQQETFGALREGRPGAGVLGPVVALSILVGGVRLRRLGAVFDAPACSGCGFGRAGAGKREIGLRRSFRARCRREARSRA